MKKFAIVVGVVLLLVIGGGLTAQVASQDGSLHIPGTIRASANPDASALDMTAWKAEQLFLAVGFILVNLVGAALTLTLVMWFLNRQIKSVGAAGKPSASQSVSSNE